MRKSAPSIGASTTNGAVIRSLGRAATKVVVFQWPCGTLATSRSPRGQRPRSLAMLVEVPVSSMKTSLVGSSRGCRCFQLARATRTSSRSCSAARRLFFEADVVPIEEPPHTTGPDHDTVLPQLAPALLHPHIRLRHNQRHQQLLVCIPS